MRILIIEDEVRLAQALSEILHKNNYLSDSVYNGEDGLDYALSGVYDLIILDVMLPKMNGLDLLRAARKQGISTPVLLLTAKYEVADKVSGLDSGADDYLTKPFATEELLARVRAMCRRKGLVATGPLTFCDISLDMHTAQLSCCTKSIKLGLKELQITELFMANNGQIISKERFLEKIWGFDADADYNNVEVYISFIRKKLAHIGSKVEIRTARGLGYAMEDPYAQTPAN